MATRPGGPPTGLPDFVGLIHAVRQVGSPLNFFAVVLALLLVFLVIAATTFALPEGSRGLIVVVGVVACVSLVAVVVWLAIRHPTFIFGERTQYLYQKMLYGTNKQPVSAQVIEALPAVAAEKLNKPQPALPLPTDEES